MYSPVSLLSSIYPLPAMHLLLVTSGFRNMGKVTLASDEGAVGLIQGGGG